nr:DUF6314 family protein [Jannaschia sp. Os4]
MSGRWRVLRAVRHADGTRARFEGHATWAPEGRGLRCVEDGTMVLGGARMPARRETVWAVEDGTLTVRFADGRPFHAVAEGWARHDCPPDLYRIAYEWGADRFAMRWRVTGPRKDYAALTRHLRL